MQSKDGGWAAFDVDNNWEILTHVPFADHNAMLDPTCADITGRTLEALAANGFDRDHRVVPARHRLSDPHAAVGRKLVWALGRGLYLRDVFRVARAARDEARTTTSLISSAPMNGCAPIQNPDGGWGESCASYDNDSFIDAESTPSQTAWALMGLMAGGDTYSSSVLNGIEYLVSKRRPPMARGMRNWPREPVSRRSFTSTIITTGSISRCWRSRPSSRPSRASVAALFSA